MSLLATADNINLIHTTFTCKNIYFTQPTYICQFTMKHIFKMTSSSSSRGYFNLMKLNEKLLASQPFEISKLNKHEMQ